MNEFSLARLVGQSQLKIGEIGNRRHACRGAVERQRSGFVVAGNVEGRAFHRSQRLADPAFRQRLRRAGRLPDIHRSEMRLTRVRVADRLNDGQRLVLIQPGKSVERRMQADISVEFFDPVGRHFDGGPIFAVGFVLERDHGVQAVVAPGELHDDEDRVLRPRFARVRGGVGRACKKRRDGTPDPHKRGILHQLAAVQHGNRPQSS